jgi:gliding motility-associated-like protein
MQHPFRFWKKTQRILLGALSIFILLLASTQEVRASHLAAADIDVRFIGPKPQQGFCGAFQTEYRYILTIRIYKACEDPFPLNSTISYNVTSPSGCAPTVSGTADTIRTEILDQLCGQFKDSNSCLFPDGRPAPYPYPGFIRNTYVDTVSLPSPCPDWTFSWTESARNAGIDNLFQPEGSLYVSCMVNNVVAPTNSSPRFTEDPIPFICVGKPASFLNGPTDVDGDSISIVSQAAQNGYQSYYSYNPPYTAINPVNSPPTDPYTVNTRTGTTTFTGPAQGKYVLAFRANEYNAAGVLIGYSDRDVQVSVLPCTIDPPQIDPSPGNITGGNVISLGANNNIVTVCPGNEISLSFNGSSQTAGAVLILSANKDVAAPSATLNVTGQGTTNVSGIFKWNPTKADVGPHTLIFTLTDSSCNLNGQSILQKKSTVVSIIVPGDVNAGPDGFYCPNPNSPPYQIKGSSPSQAAYTWSTVPGGSSTATLSCTNCLTPEARPGFPTEYIIEASPTPYLCKLRDTVLVSTNNIKITQGPEVVLCRPGSITLTTASNGLPPRQIIGCGTSDFGNCANPDSATIGTCTNPTSSTSRIANPFYTTSTATQKTQLLYRRNELRSVGVLPQTLKRIAFYVDATNSAPALSNLTISLKCTPREDLSVVGALNFETNTTNVYTGPGLVTLVQGWNYFNFDRDFNYDTTQNLLVDVCFSNPTAGSNTVALQYSPTPFIASIARYASSGNACGNTVIGTTATSPNRANMRIFGCGPANKPFEYKWTPGDFLVDSFGANTSAYVPKSIKYYVEVEGIDGCLVRDSINIIVPTDTITVSPMDSLICPGELAIIQATQSPYESYQWYEGNFEPATTLECDTCARVLARPLVDTRYTVVGTINYGNLIRQACPDTAFADVRVRPAAIINVTPEDTLIKSGQRVILIATGGESYTWTPVSKGLNTNTGPRVIAQPQESTMFIVEGLDTNGCRGSDTANVRIDYRQVLFVPTAFTPNNDGNNDVFGVVNLSVQKIIEFRVFNRWGQEIFSTTDARQGWDGTWKATLQPTGSYNYIIRVAYPNGLTDTFKGEVTLIR